MENMWPLMEEDLHQDQDQDQNEDQDPIPRSDTQGNTSYH